MGERWKWLGAKDRCWRCGTQFTEEIKPIVHHLIPRSEEGEGILGNLALLCANCHHFLHTTKMKSVGYRGARPSKSRSPEVRAFAQRFYQAQAGPPPAQCPKCSSTGKVVEVTEFSKSIAITLACPNCGYRFVAQFH